MEGFVFGDGVNEHGLAMSNQYDRGYASYATDIRDGYINISQTEVLVWALGYNRNIEELIENAKHVNVVAYSYIVILTKFLHYIIIYLMRQAELWK